ncbi:helix-turn-helix transcriptional regulator (plasmid) [Citrobacter sp. RHBSTW-00821]|nr:helix-turn-helix domain-containing protein [Serratia fonticola]QLT57133.1 helix-turn-helix transcriptional regulator [Citrobacter sp. RHBSTW-00821]
MDRNASIGKYIASLRDQADLKQNELAKKLPWSAAVLSRIESGERSLADDELEIVLDGIGTPDALKLKEIMSRKWNVLPVAPLGDPDTDLLWEAEQTAQQVHALAERPDVKQFYERRLVRYQEELIGAAALVANKRYRAAFLGTIGVGKSTAICRAEGLEISVSKGMPKAVLETGSGGITICEVHLRRGPGYGLIVEPCSDDEIRRHVSEFANVLLNSIQPSQQTDGADGEAGSPGISREVERALRNMSGLVRKRAEKKPDGTIAVPAIDKARELALTINEAKALSVEILARMELHKRDRRDMWHSSESGKAPLEWLQDLFLRVNNGRHNEFTLPKRIEMVIPTAILGDESVSVTLIDTQGIDDIAERADLEQHFDDPHTVVVLCSIFNEAPATAVRQLLTRAKEGGVRTIESHVAILALPRPGDALAMKDNGYPAQSADEGYDLKAEEVQLKLHPLGLSSLPVEFFNAAEDDPERLRTFILNRIEEVRAWQRKSLREIITGANALLENYEKAQAREVMMAAAQSLTTWLDNNAKITESPKKNVYESLLTAVRSAHPRTIYAAVVRDGDWYNLSYAHQLSYGARFIAANITEPKLDAFKAIATNLLQDEQYSEAHDLVQQTIRTAELGFDNLIRKAQLVGQSIYSDEMNVDADFWQNCSREWGRGPGYRDRINERNQKWFDETHSGNADTRVFELVKENWNEVIVSIRELLSQE